MKKESFVKGTFIATLAIIITKIIGVIYVIPFYKIIGTQGGALYAYAYNVYQIFLSVSTAGIPIAISKLVSEYNTLEMVDAKNRVYKVGKKLLLFISLITGQKIATSGSSRCFKTLFTSFVLKIES